MLGYNCNAIHFTHNIFNSYSKDNTDIKTREEVITLPESTHSFLFTEPINSLPFAFAIGIAVISYTCLALALQNNLKCGVIPSNVDISVRVAQYLSVLIALLM